MTGSSLILSDVGAEQLLSLYVEKYLSKPSHKAKLAWHGYAIAKAAIEVMNGNKMKLERIHEEMWKKYEAWFQVTVKNDDCGF